MSDAQSVTDYTATRLINLYKGKVDLDESPEFMQHLLMVFVDVTSPRIFEILRTDPRFRFTEKTLDGQLLKIQKIALVESAQPNRKPGDLDLDHIFMYHAPVGDDQARYIRLREAAKKFAQVIVDETPPSADQSAAIRHVRDAVMTSNAAIALKGRLNVPKE